MKEIEKIKKGIFILWDDIQSTEDVLPVWKSMMENMDIEKTKFSEIIKSIEFPKTTIPNGTHIVYLRFINKTELATKLNKR